MKEILKRYKAQLGDSAFGIFGLLLMNLVAQLLLFPLYAKRFGGGGYGELQYLMGYVNILTVAFGTAAGLARMTAPTAERWHNGCDYNLFLLAFALLGLPVTLLVRRFAGVAMSTPTYICYYLLFVAMLFRYYADVSYKITLAYRRYFAYYAVIGAGYVIGAALMWRTGIWPLGLLIGEAAGVLFAYCSEKTLTRGGLLPSAAWRGTLGTVVTLFLAEGASNLILNADRLVLGLLEGHYAVTVYYLATIAGKTMSLLTVPLGGVLIGHLARYEGGLPKRTVHKLAGGALAAISLFTLLCAAGGALVIRLLYPSEFNAVWPYLPIGSFAEVVYFITGLLTVVVLRFGKRRYQVIINGTFAALFFALGIPATLFFGIRGFAVSVTLAAILRFVLALALMYRSARTDLQKEKV